MNKYGISEAKSSVGFKTHAVPNRALGEAKSLRGWVLRGAVLVSAFSMVFSAFVPVATATNNENKIDICYATSSGSNPYTINNVSKNSTAQGHDSHGGDIIPPFEYKEFDFIKWSWVNKQYPGKNWDLYGQKIWDADCKASTLTLIKKVEGGDSKVSDWTLTAEGPVTASGVTGNPSITNKTVPIGTYVLSESGNNTNYQGSWSCVEKKHNQADKPVEVDDNEVNLENGKKIVCTITNTYVDPTETLTLIKVVSDGAPDANTAWTLFANGIGDENDFSGQSGVKEQVDAGTYDLNESDGPSDNYTASDWSCVLDTDSVDVPAQMIDGDTVSIGDGQNVICTIVNTYTPDPDVPLLHFIKVVCDEYEDVYGNKDADKEDDTGGKYSLFKNSPAFGGIVKPVSPDEIPKDAGCERADGWKFKLATDLPQTQNVSEVGPTNLGEFVTPISGDGSALTSEQQNAIRNGQLWISEVEKPGYGFAAIRCYNDALNGDNLEYITLGNDNPKDIYCIAYNVQTQPQEPPCKEGPTWAAGVVSNTQGLRKNGTAITDPNRINPAKATGVADWVTGTGTNFFSLGFGGTITVSFAGYVNNVVGDDLSIHEATNGTYPNETVKIEVSQDGTTWFVLSEAGSNTNPLGVTYVDFNETGLSWIKFVKLTDTSNPALFEATADGFDLDAVDATHQTCNPPVVEEECEEISILSRLTAVITEPKGVQCGIFGKKLRYVDGQATTPIEGWGIWLDNDGNCFYNENNEVANKIYTNASGEYSFTNLDKGTYYVCEERPSGWDQVYPDNVEYSDYRWAHKVVLTSQSATDKDFWNKEVTKKECEPIRDSVDNESFISQAIEFLANAVVDQPSQNPYCEISGTKYEELNDNGQIDEGDGVVGGVTIFLAPNENCDFEDNLQSTVTDENGYYEFTNLASGTYYVCELLDTGWTQLLPAGSESNPGSHKVELIYNSHHGLNFLNRDDNPEPCKEKINLIVNGGFENPPVANDAGWNIFPSGIPNLAWTVSWVDTTPDPFDGDTRPETANIELHNGVNGWTPSSNGGQYAELDSDWEGPSGNTSGEPANISLSQSVEAVTGVEYELSFEYSPRPGVTSNVMQVYWNGDLLVPTIDKDGSVNSGTDWQTYTYTVVGEAGTDTLEFREIGNPDSLGSFLDNVKLVGCDEDEPGDGGDNPGDGGGNRSSGSSSTGRVLGDSTGLPYQAPQVLGEATELPRTGTPLAIAFSLVGILAIIMIPKLAVVKQK